MARRGWDLVETEAAEVPTSRGPARAPQEFAEALPAAAASPAVRLIGAFDACLLGYKGRSIVVPASRVRRIAPGGGIIHPAVLVDGRAVARWRWGRGREAVLIEPFDPLPGGLAALLEEEVADIGRFLGVDALRLEVADPE